MFSAPSLTCVVWKLSKCVHCKDYKGKLETNLIIHNAGQAWEPVIPDQTWTEITNFSSRLKVHISISVKKVLYFLNGNRVNRQQLTLSTQIKVHNKVSCVPLKLNWTDQNLWWTNCKILAFSFLCNSKFFFRP